MPRDDRTRRSRRREEEDEFAELYEEDDEEPVELESAEDEDDFEDYESDEEYAEEYEEYEAEPAQPAARLDALFDDDEDEPPLAEPVDYDDEEPVATQKLKRTTTEDGDEPPPAGEAESEDDKEKSKKNGLASRVRKKIEAKQKRPGEQDILQSPIVITLFGGSMVLVLVAATLWFITNRNKAQRRFDAAENYMGTGQYSQAIQAFDTFILEYPAHDLTAKARMKKGEVQILQQLDRGDWVKALAELKEFNRNFRDMEEYAELRPTLRDYAERIAFGALKTVVRDKDGSLLPVAEDGMKLVRQFSPADSPPEEMDKAFSLAFDEAKETVDKDKDVKKALAAAEEKLAETPPATIEALHIRLQVMEQYPDLATHRVYGKLMSGLLAKTLETEKTQIVAAPGELEASREDPLAGVPKPIIMAEHTRTRAGEDSEGSTVLAITKGSCYGIDMVTGLPLWRRSIGLDTPFFPLDVNTSVPGILAFNTNSQELQAIGKRDGKLLWSLPLGEPAAGSPLIYESNIYVLTASGGLCQVDVETGRLAIKTTFPQRLLSPPIPTRDGQHLVLAGDAELIYTVSMQDLTGVAVTHLGHKAGSVEAPLASSVDAPMVQMGSLILLAENDRENSCLLRVLDMSDAANAVTQVATERIPGQVHDAAILRGNVLYVPSSEQRITVFTVSDDPDQQALTKQADQQIQSPHDGPMYLYAGSGGQVWLASNALRRLEMKAGTLTVSGNASAIGTSCQPIQRLGETLFIGRHRPYSSSTLFTQYNLDTETSNWGVTLGARILAWSATDGNVVCVTEDGQVFRNPAGNLTTDEGAQQKFNTSASARFNLPKDLVDPLGAIALPDGRLVAYAGGEEPRMWFVSAAGQLGRGTNIPQPIESKPVGFSDGVVFPQPNGRLKYISFRSSGSRIDDYAPKVGGDVAVGGAQPATRWMFLESIDAENLLAVDSAGKLVRIQYRKSPSRHLFGARNQQFQTPINVPFAVAGGQAYIAVGGELQAMDALTFAVSGKVPLDGPAVKPVWASGDKVFVETQGGDLHCFATKPGLKKLWTLPAPDANNLGAGLAGAPLAQGDRFILSRENGTVQSVAEADGKVAVEVALNQALTSGPKALGETLVVPTLDGAFFRIDALLKQMTN